MVVVEYGNVNIYKYEIIIFKELFTCFQNKVFLIGRSRLCKMTDESGAWGDVGYERITLLADNTNPEDSSFVVANPDCSSSEYVYIWGYQISIISTQDRIVDYISLMGINMIPTTIAVGEKKHIFLIEPL